MTQKVSSLQRLQFIIDVRLRGHYEYDCWRQEIYILLVVFINHQALNNFVEFIK